jgi:hypothetical protein
MIRAFVKYLAAAAFLAAPLAAVALSGPAAAATSKAQTTYSKQELDQLLAPVALYPDDLLSTVLVAATYPVEIVQAARWMEEPGHKDLKGEALTKALAGKDWDTSVKALAQFPDVLAMMSDQLDWTEKLGDAFLANEGAVMDRIQFLRMKAEDAGNLKSNEHQRVTTRASGGTNYIYIEPSEPDVVYVPSYEPAVYGDWWYPDYPPYFWPGDYDYVGDYYWGAGIPVYLPLWGWSSPRWHRHYIHVDVHRYNRFSRHRRIKSAHWRPGPHHGRRDHKFRHHRERRQHIRHALNRGHHHAHDRHDHKARGPGNSAHHNANGGHHHAGPKAHGIRGKAHHGRKAHAHRGSRSAHHKAHRGGHRVVHRGGHHRAHHAHHGGHRAHRGGHRGGHHAHRGGHRGGGHHGGGHRGGRRH